MSPLLPPSDAITAVKSFDHRGPDLRANGIGEMLVILPLTAKTLRFPTPTPSRRKLFGRNTLAQPELVVRPVTIDNQEALAVVYHTLTRRSGDFGYTHRDTNGRPGLSVLAGSILPKGMAEELFHYLGGNSNEIRGYGRYILDSILGITDDKELLDPYPQYEKWPGLGITKGVTVDATATPVALHEYTVTG